MKYKVGQSLRVKNRYVFHPDIKIGDIGTVISVYNDGKGVTIKFPNVGEQYCNNAEKYLEPITLSTGDMINALIENPEQKYVSLEEPNNPVKLVYEALGRKGLQWKAGASFEITNHVLNYHWTLVEEPKEVTFIEAVKAYSEGKTINAIPDYKNTRPHTYTRDGRGLIDESGDAITAYEILNYKWFVED